jgi:hypothetical protein
MARAREGTGADRATGRLGPLAGEALVAWGLWALVAAVLVVTYARLPLAKLYRVDEDGLGGALGRALVLSNWPIGLVAAALVVIALGSLPRQARWLGASAIALCATVVLPGVLDEHDLDARPVNLLPALGVAVALGLTVAAVRRHGVRFAPRQPWDAARVVVAAVVLLLSLPWLAAELGTTFPQGIFLTEKLGRDSDGTLLPAVHVGHHHGWDGALLLLSAVLLSRVRLVRPALDRALAAWVGALGAYGLVNATQDFWLEQVVKRGWVDREIPGALRPSGSWIWLVIVGLAALFATVLLRRAPATSPPSPARP